MQATEDTGYMGAVPIPTFQHVLNGDIDVLREAIDSARAEGEPTRWVVSQLTLGSALRLRAARVAEEERPRIYAEALRAFDAALAVCCELRRQAHPALMSAGGTQQVTSGPDGVQLAMDGAGVPVDEGSDMLDRAVRMFRDACAKASRRSAQPAWFVSMSNLGCALTLLGQRTPGVAGVTVLEEAVDVMHEALRVPSLERLATERATLQVNLAEALRALADRAMPSESLRYLEDATHWAAAALCHFAPPEYRWLLQLDRGAAS